MKKISEKDLLELGFTKNVVKPKESGQKKKYYYFTYEVKGNAILMTNASDELVDGAYCVEFYYDNRIGKYYGLKHVRKLIKLLKLGQK
jgi:hypothetical protein